MIGSIHEFVLAVRKALDDKIVEQDRAIIGGHAIDAEWDVSRTALMYVAAASRRDGLRHAREMIDELIKVMNEGGL